MNNPKVSIIIANYNNEIFIDECINSLRRQTYKNIEIIFFDDFSIDNSIDKIKNFDEVKIIQNIEKTRIGSFNQIKAFKEAYKLSAGEIILLLDSDDYFYETKVEEVVNFFYNNKNAKIIFDYPIIVNNKNFTKVKEKKKIFSSLWPFIHPTSCISIKSNSFNEILESVSMKIYPNVWLDFRLCIYSKYIFDKTYILNKNLTYYRQVETNVSSKFKFFGKNWWKRRMEAHHYLIHFFKLQNIKYKKNLDYFLTKIYNLFLK
ncbi:glycosyltransferase [Candidatus Pelagibacter sp.]|nr:glycosyltransferase [Candidatus Pelagibacter sp.]